MSSYYLNGCIQISKYSFHGENAYLCIVCVPSSKAISNRSYQITRVWALLICSNRFAFSLHVVLRKKFPEKKCFFVCFPRNLSFKLFCPKSAFLPCNGSLEILYFCLLYKFYVMIKRAQGRYQKKWFSENTS